MTKIKSSRFNQINISYAARLRLLEWVGIFRPSWPLDDTLLKSQQKSAITRHWKKHGERAIAAYTEAKAIEKAYEKKVKKKAKKKVKKKKCNFNKIFEVTVNGLTDHYNVNIEFLNGKRKISDHCLVELLENQIKRTAKVFRFWYRVKSSVAYPVGLQSTGVLDRSILTHLPGGKPRPGGIIHFINSLPGPVAYYWFRTEGYRRIELGAHGELYNEYK